MTLEINRSIKITPIYEIIEDDKIIRSLSYDQEPHPDFIYIVDYYNETTKEYSLRLNNRIARFTIYFENEKWYYTTHDSVVRQSVHIWIPKECIIEIL